MPDSARSSVLLLHDGELEDLRPILESIGASVLARRGHEVAKPGAYAAIVTTARHALARPESLAVGSGDEAPPRVAVVTEDSPTLRKQLRAAGFDFLVRRPIDAGILRLLFLRLLYRGPERRAKSRLPSGREVGYRGEAGFGRAILADLSESGCRLLHAASLRPGEPLTVDVPAGDGGRDMVSVPGEVLRCVRGDGDRAGFTVAVAFDELDDETLERIRAALRTGVIGSEAAAGRLRPEDRRREGRAAFRRRVVALMSEADRVLMGRDLSVGGMRVEPHPSLRPGERLRLAIHADPGAEAWVIGATVLRSDDEGGLALRFDVVSPEVARRLETFVASLPPVEALQHGESRSLGAVLTRILD
ncbi:hypothetical protein MYXO_02460 [Myxococcaceae bacterium]|jgi:hypothetical protein|nr:hypothetical protein MYXO_02460 [Myxococcaceae bacterium]